MIENFQVGDKVYEEFKLKEIKEIKDGIIWTLKGDYFISCGYYSPEQCFPVEDKVISLSEAFEKWSRELHELNTNLNYPDIKNYFTNRWIEACDLRDNDAKCFDVMQSTSAFMESVKNYVEAQKNIIVHNVYIFR